MIKLINNNNKLFINNNNNKLLYSKIIKFSSSTTTSSSSSTTTTTTTTTDSSNTTDNNNNNHNNNVNNENKYDYNIVKHVNNNNNSNENNENKNNLFAVIPLSGSQYKVTTDDLIYVNKVKNLDIGEDLTIKDVLLIGSNDYTIIGKPFIKNCSVTLHCREQTKAEKVITFKKRRRKKSQSTRGSRRDVTAFKILSINLPEDIKLELEKSE